MSFAEDGAQARPQVAIECLEVRCIGAAAEVVHPTAQDWVEPLHDQFTQAIPAGAFRQGVELVRQTLPTLFPRPLAGAFKVIAEEVEASPFTHVHQARLLGMQLQPRFVAPVAHHAEHLFGLGFRCGTG